MSICGWVSGVHGCGGLCVCECVCVCVCACVGGWWVGWGACKTAYTRTRETERVGEFGCGCGCECGHGCGGLCV